MTVCGVGGRTLASTESTYHRDVRKQGATSYTSVLCADCANKYPHGFVQKTR